MKTVLLFAWWRSWEKNDEET